MVVTKKGDANVKKVTKINFWLINTLKVHYYFNNIITTNWNLAKKLFSTTYIHSN